MSTLLATTMQALAVEALRLALPLLRDERAFLAEARKFREKVHFDTAAPYADDDAVRIAIEKAEAFLAVFGEVQP